MKHNSIASSLRARTSLVVAGLAAAAVLAGAIAPASAHPHKKHDRKVMEIKRGAFLGVKMQELTGELRDGLDIEASKGVLINEVIEDSPADKAGLQDGDVIIAFNGKDIESPSQLGDLVGDMKAGDKVQIKVLRDNRERDFKVTIADWPEDATAFIAPHEFERGMRALASDFRPRRLGVQVSELNDDLASYFGVKKDAGLLVLSVADESTAAEAGIKAGDVITKVGDAEVASRRDIQNALSGMDEGDKVAIEVVRKKRKQKLEGEVKGRSFDWQRSGFWRERAPRVPRAMVLERDNDLREEIDALRKEIEDLRKELKK